MNCAFARFCRYAECRLARALLSLTLLVLSPASLWAQVQTITATVTSAPAQQCVGDRIGRTGICNAKEFTTVLQFTQPSATAISTCIAGSYINVDVIAHIFGANTNRYDVAYFFGETGNLPEVQGGVCSVAPFPTLPAPSVFQDLDNAFTGANDTCGDFVGGGDAYLRINSVRVLCQSATGTGEVAVPYTIAWNSSQPYACNAGNVIPNPDSKCLNGAAGSSIANLTVQGYVRIEKATVPSSSTQSFSFTASTPSGVTLSTTAFNLSNGQGMTVTIPMHSTTRVINVSESLVTAWEPGASIVCLRPDGTAAPFVTVDNVNRTISASLLGANYAAICTFTNTRQTRVRTVKTLLPAAAPSGTFNLSVSTATTSTSALGVGTGGITSYLVTGSVPVTVSETAAAGTTMTHYVSTASCVDDLTGASVPLTGSSLDGTSRTATLMPPANSDASCTFTNTRSANLSVTKSNGTNTVVAGATTTYQITVANAGPGPADGTTVLDPAVSGLNCTAVSCSAAGGAVCPASPTVGQLQAGSLSIPTLPSGGSATLALSCLVTASGL